MYTHLMGSTGLSVKRHTCLQTAAPAPNFEGSSKLEQELEGKTTQNHANNFITFCWFCRDFFSSLVLQKRNSGLYNAMQKDAIHTQGVNATIGGAYCRSTFKSRCSVTQSYRRNPQVSSMSSSARAHTHICLQLFVYVAVHQPASLTYFTCFITTSLQTNNTTR